MKYLSALVLSLALVACGTLQAPQSFDERLAYAYSLDSSLREAAANALGSGLITVADAQKVLALSDQARSALDITRGAEVSGASPQALESDLLIATKILTSLQTYLASKGVH